VDCGSMGCLSFTPFLIFLKGCTFVGLLYGSKEIREESDFFICRSQYVQIVGQWDALVLHLHLFFERVNICGLVVWFYRDQTRK
jgi:hypothetical protein